MANDAAIDALERLRTDQGQRLRAANSVLATLKGASGALSTANRALNDYADKLSGCAGASWRPSSAQAVGRDARLLDWQGPATRPVLFPTGDSALALRWWAAPGRRGKVEPDAIARLRLDGRRLTLLIEWDRGAERRRRLARTLRHYLAWGSSPVARDALALGITTTAQRETLIHELIADLAARQGCRRPELWTTTAARLARVGPLGSIWRAPEATDRRALGDAGRSRVHHAEGLPT